MHRFSSILVLWLLSTARPVWGDTVVQVFDRATIHWDKEAAEIEEDGFVVRFGGQSVERTMQLPGSPDSQRDAQRVVVSVRVDPIYTVVNDRKRPNDLWNRLGSVSVLVPQPGGPVEVELARFVTGYGRGVQFEQDVTALAPLLRGQQTLRAFISTYSEKPGWRISVALTYAKEGVGPRRPVFARLLFNEAHVTDQTSPLETDITIPHRLDPPRLRIISTGHATDGQGGNEFVTCTHVLRVDGREVARWRPWSEQGGALRDLNPAAGRSEVNGRDIWASDLDRSGWHPGMPVTPKLIPLPELTRGPHHISLEIHGIRPVGPADTDDAEHHGYWVVSAVVVADEPWPEE